MNEHTVVSKRGRHHVAGSSAKRVFTPIKNTGGYYRVLLITYLLTQSFVTKIEKSSFTVRTLRFLNFGSPGLNQNPELLKVPYIEVLTKAIEKTSAGYGKGICTVYYIPANILPNPGERQSEDEPRHAGQFAHIRKPLQPACHRGHKRRPRHKQQGSTPPSTGTLRGRLTSLSFRKVS